MASSLSDDLLDPLSRWLSAHTGLHFPPERWGDLNRGVVAAARDLHFSDVESYARFLVHSAGTESQVDGIVRHLTVGETYFFRNKEALDALRTHVLPALIQARREAGRALRIWSAGCCTGEEPYTLAMMLQQTLLDWREWNITILATDINVHFLDRARKGIYREWSFRGAGPEIQQRFFTNRQKDFFEIRPDVRSMVKFDCLNLAGDNFPSLQKGIHDVDLILCRNVLMYFSQQQASETVRRLHASLAPDGWLLMSPCEVSQALMSDFTAVSAAGATLYTKTAAAGSAAPPPAISQPDQWSKQQDSESIGASSQQVSRLPHPVVPPVEIRPAKPFTSLEEQARQLYEAGNYAIATEKLQAIHANHPSNVSVMTLLARVRADQGQLDEASAWCDKAIAADKLNPAGHYLLGAILQERGMFIEAVASLQSAVFLDHNFVLAHFALGNLSRSSGRSADAARHFRNALRALDASPSGVQLPEAGGVTPQRLEQMIHSAISLATGELTVKHGH